RSGPAGLTAAIYSARADLSPLVIGGLSYGGQLMGTTLVENFPGFIDGIQGPELMNNMIEQSKRFGAEFIFENVTKVDFSDKIKKVFVGEKEYAGDAVIIAVGSTPRRLGLEAEEKFWGRGVSTCATCDAAFYRDKVVAVVGGGDSALEEATFLTKFANKVFVIHRRSELRASKAMQNRAFANDKIEFVWNTEIVDIVGADKVEFLKIKNSEDNSEKDLKVDGMFLAIGHIPNTKFLVDQIELDEVGFIKVNDNTKTNVEGVFVAGDVRDHVYQQAITASGMGCMAALDAEKWLSTQV
ncbi:thioredoxin-disulfide reductase, partial [sediment metagenome]